MGGANKSPSIGPFPLGMNNRRPEYDLSFKEGDFLRSGVNVDITSTGSARRRRGVEHLIAGSDCHSLWGDGALAYYIDGDVLKAVTGLDTTPVATTVKSGLTRGRRASMFKDGDSVYFTNGTINGRIDAHGFHDLGCQPLASAPSAAFAAGGSLQAGSYQLCFAFVNADGEQSGTTWPITVNLPGTGSIEVSGLPAAFPAGVSGLAVFASPLNSDLLMQVAVLKTPAVTLNLPVLTYGGRCQTLMLTAMPTGSIVRVSNGRLLIASGNTLHYSEPFAYSLTNPVSNYITFNSPITTVQPVGGGVYVVADKTYWLAGDIASTSPLQVLPYGSVPGSGGSVPHEEKCWWMSDRGLVVGDAAGAAVNVQEANVAIYKAEASAGLFRESDGIKQVLISMFNTGISGAAARSYMDAEIVRKGITL